MRLLVKELTGRVLSAGKWQRPNRIHWFICASIQERNHTVAVGVRKDFAKGSTYNHIWPVYIYT